MEVTLDELKKGYSRQSDYTRKTEKLSQDRKSVEELKNENTRLNEEAKIKRDQYEKQLQVLSEQLKLVNLVLIWKDSIEKIRQSL